MRSAPDRAADLARALAQATGAEPRTTTTDHVTRVEVDLPEGITAEMSAVALAAAETADRYGQYGTSTGSTLWAEIAAG